MRAFFQKKRMKLGWFIWGEVPWELNEKKTKMLPAGQQWGGTRFQTSPSLSPSHPWSMVLPWMFHLQSMLLYTSSLQSHPILSFPLLYCAILPCSILPYTLFHSTLYPVPFYPTVSLYPNLLFSILIVLLILRCFFSSYSVPSHHTLFLLILHCSFSSYIVPSHPTVQWSNSFISFSNYLFQIFYISVQLKRTMSYFNLNCSLSSYSVSFRRILILHLSFI